MNKIFTLVQFSEISNLRTICDNTYVAPLFIVTSPIQVSCRYDTKNPFFSFLFRFFLFASQLVLHGDYHKRLCLVPLSL